MCCCICSWTGSETEAPGHPPSCSLVFSFFHCQRSPSFEICLCHCMLRLTLWNDRIVTVMIALSLVPLSRYSHYRQWRIERTALVSGLANTCTHQCGSGCCRSSEFTAAENHWRHFSLRGAGKSLWVHEPLFAPFLRDGDLYSSSLG